MYWPEPFLHVVRSQEVCCPGKFMQKPILVAEHRSRSDDGGFREDATHDFLAPSLQITNQPGLSESKQVQECWCHTFVRKKSEGEFLLAL